MRTVVSRYQPSQIKWEYRNLAEFALDTLQHDDLAGIALACVFIAIAGISGYTQPNLAINTRFGWVWNECGIGAEDPSVQATYQNAKSAVPYPSHRIWIRTKLACDQPRYQSYSTEPIILNVPSEKFSEPSPLKYWSCRMTKIKNLKMVPSHDYRSSKSSNSVVGLSTIVVNENAFVPTVTKNGAT